MSTLPKRALFITLSNIGDAVMTTPVLRRLEMRYPDVLVDISARRRTASLFKNYPRLGKIVAQPEMRTWSERIAYLAEVRSERYDLCIDLKSAFMGTLMNAGKAHVRRRRYSSQEHAVVSHARVLEPTISPSGIPTTMLWPAASDLENVKQKIGDCDLGYGRPQRLIALGPGANWPPKCWSPEHFINLITALKTAFPNSGFVVLGDQADAERCAYIATIGSHVRWLRDLTLNEVAALLACCDLFVGNDSGLGHIASAMATPTVTMFGPGEPARYRPWGPRALTAVSDDGCIDSIKPAVVARLCMRQLAGVSASRRR